MLIAELYDDFLAYQAARGCSPLTITAYRQDRKRLEAFLAAAGVPAEVEALGAPVVRRYLVWLREQGYKPWTIRRRTSSLRAFLGYCVEEGYLERHPMSRVPTPKAPTTVPRYLTAEEVRKVLAAVDQYRGVHRLRDQALMRVLLFTGVRRSELLGMRWTDVDLKAGALRVHGKGAKERILPLEPETVARLRAYRETHLMREDEPLWRNQFGNAMGKDTLARVVRRWLAQAGIPKHATPHTMRHTFATLLLRDGTPLKAVQELLGHEEIGTTSMYTLVDSGLTKAAVAGLAARMQNPDTRPDNG